MKKYLFLFFCTGSITFTSYCQTTIDKINQLKKDPQTTENAARADLITINKKMITLNDTVVTKQKGTRTKKFKWRSNRNSQ